MTDEQPTIGAEAIKKLKTDQIQAIEVYKLLYKEGDRSMLPFLKALKRRVNSAISELEGK